MSKEDDYPFYYGKGTREYWKLFPHIGDLERLSKVNIRLCLRCHNGVSENPFGFHTGCKRCPNIKACPNYTSFNVSHSHLDGLDDREYEGLWKEEEEVMEQVGNIARKYFLCTRQDN